MVDTIDLKIPSLASESLIGAHGYACESADETFMAISSLSHGCFVRCVRVYRIEMQWYSQKQSILMF
jgi:hypothetical protein